MNQNRGVNLLRPLRERQYTRSVRAQMGYSAYPIVAGSILGHPLNTPWRLGGLARTVGAWLLITPRQAHPPLANPRRPRAATARSGDSPLNPPPPSISHSWGRALAAAPPLFTQPRQKQQNENTHTHCIPARRDPAGRGEQECNACVCFHFVVFV